MFRQEALRRTLALKIDVARITRHFPQSGDEVKQALMDPDSGNVPEKGPQSPQARNIVYFTKELATSLWSAKPFTR